MMDLVPSYLYQDKNLNQHQFVFECLKSIGNHDNKQIIKDEEFSSGIFDIFSPVEGVVPWLLKEEKVEWESHNELDTSEHGSRGVFPQELTMKEENNRFNNSIELNTSDNGSRVTFSQKFAVEEYNIEPVVLEVDKRDKNRSSKRNPKHDIQRLALFKGELHSAVLNGIRLAALKRSSDTYELVTNFGKEGHNRMVKIKKELQVDGKTEAEKLKAERYQKRLASNRKTGKRARIRRENYIYALEKQLESLDHEIQILKKRAETFEKDFL